MCHLIEWVCSFSHRFTQKTRTHKGQKDDGPSPDPSWPLPLPLPRREGEWLPRYPYGLDVGFVLSLISIENSSNVLWYLYAEGLLWVRNSAQKVLLDLWVLWEKKLPSVKEMLTHTSCQQASRGNLTYHAPPCGGGVGGGATLSWDRNCAQMSSVKSVSSVRERKFLRERKNSSTCYMRLIS